MVEELLIDQSLSKIETLFRFSGINITSGEQIPSTLKNMLIYWSNLLILLYSYFGSFVWFTDGVKSGKDFLELTELSPCISIATCALAKGVLLNANEKQNHKLIKTLRDIEIQGTERQQSLKKKSIATKEKKALEALIDVLIKIFAAVLISYASSPLVVMAVKYYKSSVIQPGLPILVSYPFDEFDLPYWPFVYVQQFWSQFVTVLYIGAADYFFFTCCTYINIQFKLLQEDIVNLLPSNINEKVLENEQFRIQMRELIERHQVLIESANILEIIYSKSTLLNFMTSSLIICLAGFNITVNFSDLIFVAKFAFFLCWGLVQIFFLCYFADIVLSRSSLGVSEAVCNSCWYNAEAKIRKDLLLIFIRAQRPCKITAYGFADVNLNSFMRVLSTSYSYFALLQTMYAN